nr:branched-chain amino acid ABC transporter ATP-binding protein/permease [Mesorhizobium sp.]
MATGAATPSHLIAPAAAGVALAGLPLLVTSDYVLFLLTQAAVLYLVALGLNVLTGYGGITSIGHGALVAVGAYATGIATVDHGWPFWGGMAAAILSASLCGLLLALPAFRLSTWYFALITLGFGSVVSGLIMELGWLTYGFSGIVGIPLPEFFGATVAGRNLFWLVAGTGFGAFLVTRNLIGSRFGRALLAIKENPLAAMSAGVRTGAVKVGAFVYSAALAGIAGAFFAANQSVITPDDFSVHFSIYFLLVIVLGGLGNLHGPLLGTAAFFLLPYLMTGLQEWRLLIYAVGLLILMIFFPQGLAGLLALFARRIGRHPSPATTAIAKAAIPRVNGAQLDIDTVGKRFGGVQALSNVTLAVPSGTIHGIVGPNGSGKTTLVNLISGFYGPDGGEIHIDGISSAAVSASGLARQGVRRTFQTPKLIPDLSIVENVMFGAYSDERASLSSIALGLPSARREARERRAEAMSYLDFVGLAAQADMSVGEATHGQQRLAEIARALVGRPRLLLLDEPAAGLSMAELEGLRETIAAIAATGTTVVIVEHHLELIADLCARVTVLDRGRVLKEGTPAQVFADPEVLATYMGRRALGTETA